MLPTIKTLLYATDLSPEAPRVFRHAVAHARRHEARIILLHVLEPLGPMATTLVRNVVPAESLAKLQQDGLAKVRDEVAARLERFCAEELSAGAHPGDIVSDIRIVEGQPARTILDEAVAVDADMIVMGMHGYSGVERLMLGSVANKVVHRSTIPVLLVPIPAD